MQPTYDLSILIVTYKTKQMVLDCIKSSQESSEHAGVSYQIIVVDNASNDGTVEAVKQKFPEVKLLVNNENLGPAKAYNQALRTALPQSRYVMLLNSDIVVWPETVGYMYNYLESHPNVSGVCGDLLFPNGERQKIRTQIISLRKPNYTKRFQATFIGSGFNMLRVEAFEQVGLYDETYYFYNEDLDWAERAKRKGLKFMFLPEAKVTHYQGQGSKQNRYTIDIEGYKHNLYYFRKFYNPIIVGLAYYGMLLTIRTRLKRLKAEAKSSTSAERQVEITKWLNSLVQARKELIRYKKEGIL